MGLKELNCVFAGLLAVQGFALLAVSIHFSPDPKAEQTGALEAGAGRSYYSPFLLFWSLAWAVAVVDWLFSILIQDLSQKIWMTAIVDSLEDVLFGSAAYVLFRGLQFHFNDKYLKSAWTVLPAVVLLFAIPSAMNPQRDGLLLRLLFGSLDLFLVEIALLALGALIFRELRGTADRLRVLILAVFLVYAYVEIPAFVIHMNEASGSRGLEVLRIIFIIEKVVLFFAILAAVISFYRKSAARPVLVSIRMWSLAVGAALSVVMVFLKFAKAVSLLDALSGK